MAVRTSSQGKPTLEKQDEAIEHMLNSKPLVIFSVYTHLQVETLNKLGSEILGILDASMKEECIEPDFHQVYGKFWLWGIGAYEVVRTMTDKKTGAADCFSDRIKKPLAELKDSLADIRMPFAKQEIRGNKREIISNEASIACIDQKERDFAFSINNKPIWVRRLVAEFQEVFSSISRADVLIDLREAERPGKPTSAGR